MLHPVLASAGVVVVATVDTLIVLRVLRAYRSSGRRPHLVVAAGIIASLFAVIGGSLVFAAEGLPELRTGPVWTMARAFAYLGAALAYGFVGLFAAIAFGRTRFAVPLSVGALIGLVAIATLALLAHGPEVATPATTRWIYRLPFLALAEAGSAVGFVRARALFRAYRLARRAGRPIDGVALGRMQTMANGFLCMAVGQLALLGFAPLGRFDTVFGFACVGAIMLGALGFTLACVATWATPPWLRTRWLKEAV